MAIQTTFKEDTFGVGDVVRVYTTVVADDSTSEKSSRTQMFEGTVIGIRGRDMGKSFAVRRIGAANIGIEQIFPINSPLLEKVEVIREGTRGSRQAKLYYIRDKSKKEIETIYTRAKRRGNAPEVAKAKPVKKVATKKAPVKKAAKKASVKKVGKKTAKKRLI